MQKKEKKRKGRQVGVFLSLSLSLSGSLFQFGPCLGSVLSELQGGGGNVNVEHYAAYLVRAFAQFAIASLFSSFDLLLWPGAPLCLWNLWSTLRIWTDDCHKQRKIWRR